MVSIVILIINTAGGLFFSPSVLLSPCAVTTHCHHSSIELILSHVAVEVWVNNEGKRDLKNINHNTLYLCTHFLFFLQSLYLNLTIWFLHCSLHCFTMTYLQTYYALWYRRLLLLLLLICLRYLSTCPWSDLMHMYIFWFTIVIYLIQLKFVASRRPASINDFMPFIYAFSRSISLTCGLSIGLPEKHSDVHAPWAQQSRSTQKPEELCVMYAQWATFTWMNGLPFAKYCWGR